MRHEAEQPATGAPGACSHSSVPARMPSPHAAASHRAPTTGQLQPLSTLHVALQPSLSFVLPSSHASVPVITLSPQLDADGPPSVHVPVSQKTKPTCASASSVALASRLAPASSPGEASGNVLLSPV